MEQTSEMQIQVSLKSGKTEAELESEMLPASSLCSFSL
jgi:hypothetical protein